MKLPFEESDALARAKETFEMLAEALEVRYGSGPWALGSVGEFQQMALALGVPRSTFYRHLKDLRAHGLVRLGKQTTLELAWEDE